MNRYHFGSPTVDVELARILDITWPFERLAVNAAQFPSLQRIAESCAHVHLATNWTVSILLVEPLGPAHGWFELITWRSDDTTVVTEPISMPTFDQAWDWVQHVRTWLPPGPPQ